ncbi:MAG: hypothetical protein K9H16_04820 [Bacteroidales bacterium]|nr:hypothetical protein [Bacteroidales bacterium]
MNKENFNKTIQGTFKNIKEYFDLKTELYALIIFERISKMLSKFMVVIIFVFFVFFFLLFISLAFINWFHEITGTSILGYIIAAFFYLFLGLIIYAMSTKLFLNPMLKGFTEVLFEKEEKLDSDTKSKQNDEEN